MERNIKVIYFVCGMAVTFAICFLLVKTELEFEVRLMNLLTAFGTVGAVIVALYFSYGADRRAIKRDEIEFSIALEFVSTQIQQLMHLSTSFIGEYDTQSSRRSNLRGMVRSVPNMKALLEITLVQEKLELHYRVMPPQLRMKLMVITTQKLAFVKCLEMYEKSRNKQHLIRGKKCAVKLTKLSVDAFKIMGLDLDETSGTRTWKARAAEFSKNGV